MACCCAGENLTDPADLPIEPEHSDPDVLPNMERKPSSTKEMISELKDLGISQHVEMLLGAVTVPGNASQGMELLHSPEASLLVVSGVFPDGPWEAWNQSHPDNLVEPGDRILAVNGKGEHHAAKGEIMMKSTETRQITLHVRKPVERHVRVTKEKGESMGLGLIPLENGNLIVDRIVPDGLIAAWNAENPDSTVKTLDMIVEVNGVRGHHQELIKTMKEGGDMELILMTHED